MIYKNAEIHNIEYITENADGSISWCRVPENVYNSLETDSGRRMAKCTTGVEIRFKMNCDKVTLRMAAVEYEGIFHVYRGSVQGGWEDHELNKFIAAEPKDFVIERSKNPDWLKKMTEKSESGWNSEVVRIIFDRGAVKLYDIAGDIEPPAKGDCPEKTLFCYGSSITHGSNSIDMSHSWPSVTAHNLNYDVKNKGMAGSCCMEPAFADYIAAEGSAGRWDVLTLELGINVLGWDEEKMKERAENTITKIAEANPGKPILVISPFYHCEDDFVKEDRAGIWRSVLEEICLKHNYPNVTYINGLDIIGDMTMMSADFVHPNIYGIERTAIRITEIIKSVLNK